MPNNRIAPLRRENGMNQKELGEQLGVAQTTVSAWETGKTEPDSSALGKMANLFHVSIGYLMGYEGESPTRGLSQAEYDALVRKLLEERRQREIEEQVEALEREAEELDEADIAEYFHQQNLDNWKKAGRPDTLEGYLASRLIDDQPAAIRQWLYHILQELAKAPRA